MWPEMPARQGPESPEARAVREVMEEDEATIEAIVREAGPPPDAQKLSEREEDTAWETMDPSVDDEQFATLLMTQGLPPELVQRLLVVRLAQGDPERMQAWIGALTQPTQDAELAQQLTRLVKWPFRAALLEDIDDPDEQVKKADLLDRRYQRRMAGFQEVVQQPGFNATAGGYRGMGDIV